MAVMNGGRAVMETIRAHGTTHAFCVPGESFLAVMDAFYEAEGTALIAARHEGGAVLMAEAWAKATGRVGVAMATRGVGAGNMAIGVHTARQDSTPLVVILGQVPTGWKYREAFQEVDQDRFMGSIAKWAITIDRTDRIPELLQRAFRVAMSGRPGPVVVTLPEDVTAATADLQLAARPAVSSAPRPDSAAIREAAVRLLQAGRPVIIAGAGVLRAGATAELQALATAAAVPVYAAWRRWDVFDNEHPLFAGRLGVGTLPAVTAQLREADLVLAIGTRLQENTTSGYTLPGAGTDLIHIDIDPAVLGVAKEPTLGIVADAGHALRELLQEVGSCDFADTAAHRERMAWASSHRRALAELTTPRPWADSAPVNPEGVIHAMREVLPQDAAIVSDAGNFAGWLSRYYSFRQPGTFYAPTSGAMGYGLPGAIGVKLATPNRPVVCLAGDGGFMMSIAELDTAMRVGANIVALVFNNGLYGTIRAHQERRFPGRPVATALTNPSFAAVAREFGCYGERVACNAEFPDALQRALSAGRPAVLELITSPERLSANQP